jgi:Ca-activated chloride channel family protein
MRPIVVLALLLSSLASESRSQQTAQPSFRTGSELVVLPVSVKDRKGAFVSDLPRERFVVHDNGRPQELALFNNEDTPVSIALVVDDSGSMRGKLGQVIASAHVFATSSNPEDELFAFEFNDRVRDALGGRRILVSDSAELTAGLETLVPTGQTALYDALATGLAKLETATHSRKVLVLVSDGGDNASRDSTIEQVLLQALQSNVTVYTIGLFEPGAPDTNPAVLQKLAVTTGGERHLPKSPGALIQACRHIARAIRSGYMLGYQPPARDGAYHRVQIRIAGPGGGQYHVRTRAGYYAAKN